MLRLSQFPYRAPTVATYRTGDGKGHLTLEAAIAHRSSYFKKTGVIIAVESAENAK
jgi:hypothetical protein